MPTRKFTQTTAHGFAADSRRVAGQSRAADPAIVPVEGPRASGGADGKARGIIRSAQDETTADTGAAGTGTAGVRASGTDGAGTRAPYGTNNEQLPERLQEALRRLVFDFGTESELSRRQEIRRIKQAHQFWRGLQYLWWDERDQNWHLPFEQKMMEGSSLEDLPRYEFVTNIYQAFGLSLIAVLSQDVPRVRFFPASAQAEEDVAAARAATEVAGLVERNNRIGNLIGDEAFNLWTDGKAGAYVRFVVDGQRFGFHPETEIGMREVRVGGDVYVCPDCGAETAAAIERANAKRDPSGATRLQDDSGFDGATTSTGTAGVFGEGEETPKLGSASNSGAEPPHSTGAISGGNSRQEKTDPSVALLHQDDNPDRIVACAECGALLSEEDFVAAETITVPAAQTRLRVPNGQEVITIVGGLELKTPPWANEMAEYPYLQWNMEVHKARLRAAYPHAADKIGSPVAASMQEYERLARLAQSQGGPMTEGGDYNINLITFQRTWLRPWAFFALDDKALRDELLQLFPDGAYAAFAGDVYCESRNENMDDHWRVLHALPGDGSSGRPALGDALISVQERFNTLSNLQIETYEYGIPPIYADSEVLDFDSLQSQTAEPGAHYPARAKPGQSLASGFFQPEAASVPPDLAEHAANLMGPVAQFLTGAFPALFGGAMSNNDTAAGYSMARDQAMGRIGLVWRRMKFFHADVMGLAVDCFRRNRPNDVEVTLLGAGAAFESKWIHLADLKGNLFSYPETDEQYPTLWAQQRGVLLQLMGSPDPQIQAMLSNPENLALAKRLIGLEELVIPDEESRTKQYREIAQMVGEAPIVARSNGSSNVIPNPAPTPSVGAGGEGSAVSGANENQKQVPRTPPRAPASAGEEKSTRDSARNDNAWVSREDIELTLPSIMPDQFADNHAVELEACMRWFSSDAGQVAKIEAPAGYANVRAHAMFHREYLLKQQQQAAQEQQVAAPTTRARR
ncbi:MAG TPA: hypothetical protein VNK23_12470 [Candidatus Dormibacteraeota bacterium]|nr:hypothetical protein [Candidatus Dormibacteraeota bacterium]